MERLPDIPEHFNNPLFTDFYQITMSYSYFKNGKHNEQASFEAFFWECPFKGKFTIFAGLDEVVNYIKTFKFLDTDIEYL